MQTSFEIRGDRYVYIRTKQVGDRLLRAEHLIPSKVGTPWQNEENRQQFLAELRVASQRVDESLFKQEHDPSFVAEAPSFEGEPLDNKPDDTSEDEKTKEKENSFATEKRSQYARVAKLVTSGQITSRQAFILMEQIDTELATRQSIL
jgi:hypothetical protein